MSPPVRPDFDVFCERARDCSLVPVRAERLGDLITPVGAALKLFGGLRRPFLLESAEGGEHIGRYSYLGGDPFLEVTGDAGGLLLQHRGGTETRIEENPVAAIGELQARYRAPAAEGAPPFAGGAVGYLGYDAIRWVEQIGDKIDPETPWCWLGFYDTVVAFDHLKHRIVVVGNAHVRDGADRVELREAYEAACDRIAAINELLEQPGAKAVALDGVDADSAQELDTRSDFSGTEYGAAVGRAQDHIAAGDAFQIVLSRRLECETSAEPLTVYRALRAINPSPYMYCLETSAGCVVGSSPEMLARVGDGLVETRPIAGTRRRDSDPAVDDALAEELLADDKERAEHLMLVDLGRNDVGRVAAYGGVSVPTFMRVERYSHVMHIVSSVIGRLRDDVSPIEALIACFPAGTVSGAPKIRAMQIIDDLEQSPRGLYAGAVLYSDFRGNLNSCIAIRTIVMRDGVATVRAGAGIVADSVGDREFEETSEKAAAPLQALAWAEAASRADRDGEP